MRARLRYLLERVRTSYWFLPTLMVIGTFALAFGALQLDQRFGAEALQELGWIYTGGPDGARAVLSTIAGSMITVAGVAFSITIVALSLASSQFGPRVLHNFMRDRGNQVVLGTFIATFLYCLLILRTIYNADSQGEQAHVPQVSVTIATLLALASIGVLIFFIHHVAISIQAPQLIASIAKELEEHVRNLYPESAGQGPDEVEDESEVPEGFRRDAWTVNSPRAGYVEAVDLDALLELARENDVIIGVEHRPGSFAVEGAPLGRIWPESRASEELAARVRGSFAFGSRRTAIQDLEFSVDQLVEIAVRALSPGINDPFTAMNCVDQLSNALCQLGQRRMPAARRYDAEGRLRLVAGRPLEFQGVVDSAFNQIRQNASYHAAVYIRMLERISTVVDCIENEGRRAVLLRHAELIHQHGMEEIAQAADRDQLRRRFEALVANVRQSPQAGDRDAG